MLLSQDYELHLNGRRKRVEKKSPKPAPVEAPLPLKEAVGGFSSAVVEAYAPKQFSTESKYLKNL